MDKELQNKVWSVLPKEFKEEVKICYQYAYVQYGKSDLHRGSANAIESLFGHHNLTSDAEGEEMLTCEKSKVMKLYNKFQKDGTFTCLYAAGVLDDLFGSKCLPDESVSEPKFRKGDLVRNRCDGKVYAVNTKAGKYHYALSGLAHDVHEEFLEPYTEPKETKAEEMADKAIKPVAEHFDNILRKSFAKDRRLNIAARMMQGLICAPLVPGVDPNPPAECLAQTAFRLANALIAEWHKD